MKEYEWDLRYLKKVRDELEEKVKLYENTLATYQALIDSFDKRVTSYDFLDDYKEVSIKDFISTILSETNNSELDLLLKSRQVLNKYNSTIEDVNMSPLYLNNQELVDYTMELIKNIPHKKFVEEIKSLTCKERNLLHIKHNSKLSTSCHGLTFIDFKNHLPYGLVARENSIQDVITLGHELFHIVIRKN